MRRQESSLLRSNLLLDVKAQFSVRRRGWPKQEVELNEEQSESVLDESLEILRYVTRGYELFIYQGLTIWGDQVASYTIRECVKKRMYRLVHTVQEFPLIADPIRIVDTFWWCAQQLRDLDVPPGKTQSDQELLQRVEARWIGLSGENTH